MYYNSSLKEKGCDAKFNHHMQIPDKIFFNDMSKNYMCEAFKSCDCLYSEIAWPYGYKGFNEKAENNAEAYSNYINNIMRLIDELKIPSFIVCGKNVQKHLSGAEMSPITITTSGQNIKGCTLYSWNFDVPEELTDTDKLTTFLAERFSKCLDISCGYGTHLLKFDDFVGCDVNKDCLTYLSILTEYINKRKEV